MPVFKPFLEYIQKVKEHPEVNNQELFITTVVEPLRKEAFEENKGMSLKDQYSFTAPISMDQLNESIILMDENYKHLCNLIKDGLEKSAKLLPGEKKKTIYLLPINPDQSKLINQMSGVAAFTYPNQTIFLQLSPQHFKEEMLLYTISHEYHHAIYLELGELKNDLIEYALVEGKADSFANSVIPSISPPWTAELSQEEEQSIWNWISERRYSFNEKDLFEMSRGVGNLPQWANYKIGHQIMQDFLKKNPEVPLNEWTFMDPDEILEKSHFAGRFK